MKIPETICFCQVHPETKMICPRCVARGGGLATAKKFGTQQLAKWGRKGGKKNKKASGRKPAAGRKK